MKVEDLQPFSRVEILISCDVCGDTKEIIYSNYHKSISKNGIYACRGKCSNVKKKITNLKKFGKEWSVQNEEIKKKIIKTNLERCRF